MSRRGRHERVSAGGPLRIAMFSDNFHPELSGISDSILTLAGALASGGHRFHLFAPRYTGRNYQLLGLPQAELDLGPAIRITRCSSLPYPTGTRQGRLAIPTGLRWRALRAFRPDLIHVHLPFTMGIEGLVAARALGAPLVGTNHTPISEFLRYSPIRGRWLERLANRYVGWFYRQCDFVSSPAQSILTEMAGALRRVPSRAISNPIRLDDFGPLPDTGGLKQKFGFPPFTVLYFGRLAPEKRLDLVLRAVAHLAPDLPDLGVAFAGRGSAEHHLKALCRALGLDARVKFLGFVPELSTVVEIYNAADVFVMTSTAETQSISTMQAMACGLPVVGVRAWGLQEYINPTNGILIDPGDERALREALLSLHTDPAARARLGQGGQRCVKAYSVPAIAAEWEGVYRMVLDRFQGQPGNEAGAASPPGAGRPV